ncbi:MAG: rhomboid family intramembrane serine protease [Thermoleophilia bacterium]|nr:rhomboid family intramembrane serine protease [Thermoleophilia bacterium]
MNDRNAAGTRVMLRGLWQVFLLLFVTSGLYRVWWMFATSRDLGSFVRGRAAGQRPAFRTMPWIDAGCVALAYPGYLFIWLGLLPWGVAAHSDMSTTARVVLSFIGLVLVAPAAYTVIRTGQRVAIARQLAGLPHDRFDAQPFTWLLVAGEAIGVPMWTFALQQRLNSMWVRFPTLYNEDLFGELAPGPLRAELTAKRPGLHALRRAARPTPIEDPSVRPWVALGFFALCAAVYAWQVGSFGFGFSDADIRDSGAVKLHTDGFWWRFWTANLIHGSIGHIVGNMTVWIVVTFKLERAVGHSRMLLMIVLGAAASTAGEMIYMPNEYGLGASGVVFAAIGMAAAIDLFARHPLGWLAWTMVFIGVPASFFPGIGTGAHMGGLLLGLVLGLIVRYVWKVKRDATSIARHEARLLPALNYTAPLAPRRVT